MSRILFLFVFVFGQILDKDVKKKKNRKKDENVTCEYDGHKLYHSPAFSWKYIYISSFASHSPLPFPLFFYPFSFFISSSGRSDLPRCWSVAFTARDLTKRAIKHISVLICEQGGSLNWPVPGPAWRRIPSTSVNDVFDVCDLD